MMALSLHQYLQQKGAEPAQGVRTCAPSLQAISLRAVLGGIKRRIIHLTDLHIGLNHSSIPTAQVESIVDSIIKAYPAADDSYEHPRPLVVVTGDIVDHYTSGNLSMANSLLGRLTQHGFTVLVVPGNHDYGESFSTDSFTPQESIPGSGDFIKAAARVANSVIGKGQDHQLVSGLTLDPPAVAAFHAHLGQYYHNGRFIDSWKDKGAVHDLDFILLDGQDRKANPPDWDVPKEVIRAEVRKAAMNFEVAGVKTCPAPLVDKIADSVAEAVADVAADLGPVAAAALAGGLVKKLEFQFGVPDMGLALAVGAVVATYVGVPLLPARFFLGDKSFRLAHGYLDDSQQKALRTCIEDDSDKKRLPIACLHYWLNDPTMDMQHNINMLRDESDKTVVNETPALFSELVDHCHLLLVGHVHQDHYGRTHTFQASTRQDGLAYYSRAGATFPDPIDWVDSYRLKERQVWLELTVNLNTAEIAEPCLVHVDGTRLQLPHDRQRLQPGQRLAIHDSLVSNNGWFRLAMQDDGDVALYRTQTNHRLWSTKTAAMQVDHLEMDRNGRLAACTADGTVRWCPSTAGHPATQLVLGDDGNLVIYDRDNRTLWQSGTFPDLASPTIMYPDADGYQFSETSESWKRVCAAFPCFIDLQWTGYPTTIVPTTIDGHDVVIQLWKGWCGEKIANLPGGIGAEVGVYRRIPGKLKESIKLLLDIIGSLPLGVGNLMRQVMDKLPKDEDKVWWPFPELNAKLELSLINPLTGQAMFAAGPENSYWLAKWMFNDSYARYRRNVGESRTPASPADYLLEYRINGQTFRRW